MKLCSPLLKKILLKALENAIAEVAKREGFKAVIGMNTGSVTQHVSLEHGYQRIETIKVNDWSNSQGFRCQNRSILKIPIKYSEYCLLLNVIKLTRLIMCQISNFQ